MVWCRRLKPMYGCSDIIIIIILLLLREKKIYFNIESRNISIWQNKCFEIKKENYVLETNTCMRIPFFRTRGCANGQLNIEFRCNVMSPYRTNKNARLLTCENVWTHRCKDAGLNPLKHSIPVPFKWSSLGRCFEQCTRFHNYRTLACQTSSPQHHVYKISAHRQILTILVTHFSTFIVKVFYN